LPSPRCEREKWDATPRLPPGGRRCEREKWGSHATHRIPGATSKIQTVAVGPTHQPTSERPPHSQPTPALPALHRQMNAAKIRVLPTKQTHGQQIAILKQKGEYTQLCPSNQTDQALTTLVHPGVEAPNQTRSDLNQTNNRHPTKQAHVGLMELGQTQPGSNLSQARI